MHELDSGDEKSTVSETKPDDGRLLEEELRKLSKGTKLLFHFPMEVVEKTLVEVDETRVITEEGHGPLLADVGAKAYDTGYWNWNKITPTISLTSSRT